MSLQGNRSEKDIAEKAAIRLVEAVFNTVEIRNWRTLKKGMTNRSFVFSVYGEQYIVRVPGEGTEKLIDRKQEAIVYKTISGLGFCDDPVYIDAEKGYKITRYLDSVRSCDAHCDNDLIKCMAQLRRLHTMRLEVPHNFDLIGKISFYEKLWENTSVYPDYEETKKRVFALCEFIEKQDCQLCLSHLDSVSDNFLFYRTENGEGLQLTDWEYAGMQDPHIDIAMFCVYENYTRHNIDKLIDIYFHGVCDQSTRTKIYCYIAVCGLLWSNWCEYKYHLGVDFGEYALRQYQYARDYCVIANQEIRRL